MSIGMKETYLAQEFLRRKPEQGAHARILQRRYAEIAPLQNGSQPARNSRAEFAISVKKKPASCVPAFAIGVDIH